MNKGKLTFEIIIKIVFLFLFTASVILILSGTSILFGLLLLIFTVVLKLLDIAINM